MNRKWRDIKGYPGYMVSDHGEIVSFKGKKPMILRPSITNGYKRLALRGPKSIGQFSVHSLVAQAFIGTRPSGQAINHIDFDPLNNKASNLEYCTHNENFWHTYNAGRHCIGEDHHKSKLTPKDIRFIRETDHGMNKSELARKFKVWPQTICNVISGESWRHLLPEAPNA